MYKHILLPTDGSKFAEEGVRQGCQLAKELGAKVTVVTVTESLVSVNGGELAMAFPVETYDKATRDQASVTLENAAKIASEVGVDATTLHVEKERPVNGILKAAESTGADLIVMSSHGRHGISRMLLGSQATAVVSHSEIPVLVFKPKD
ncbi:universal stress protein [Pseudahrensia aquimaris]|uniref:Universal stress protein n=1 Tax=Pseudahrensia aquimaris TaxID=744461 RepID=A0ABW3FCT1_9HYPH